MVAAALGILPLTELFTDVRWFLDALGAIIVVCGTAAALRWWYRPRVLHTWIGLALLVPWLVWRFTGTHAAAGFIPTRATWHYVSGLLARVRDTTSNGVAPVHADAAITLVLAALAGLVAAFVDFVAVIGRRAALAGIPLLVVFTVAGAVPRHPVPWLLFGSAAAGFLLLLSIDARDEVRGWGRIIPRAGESRPSAALGVSGPRIAVIATLIALALPFLIPTRASNLLANALHNSSAGGADGGFGAGGISLDPFAALKGELQRSKPISLFTVTVSPSQTDSVGTPQTVAPYYLRANVLNSYSVQGWSAASHGVAVPASGQDFSTAPATPPSSSARFSARIDVSGLGDNAPVFAQPTSLTGTDDRTTWSPTDQILLGHNVGRGDHITEDVAQPNPTVAQLAAAPDAYSAQFADQYGKTAGVTAAVKALVGRLTAGKSTPYGKALALNDYFTDPANGFKYSLQTKPSDDVTALDSFLSSRSGYCQQYAASMAIMLRVAGVPARVVLGYSHSAPDSSGAFTVTTNNAHAWAEAYFVGIGWLPFDTTPLVPAPGAATAILAWAPRPVATTPTDVIPTRRATGATPSRRAEATVSSGTAVGTGQQ
ncbi:MAG: DUF3488 and transglutaminase-like domain-containing protein, partial [Actinomycetota bacterium]|nr:DUF3488 and transglutaminase-like domain-containing protein [Actinomycetota bacterium]